jgi:hypothetical protein
VVGTSALCLEIPGSNLARRPAIVAAFIRGYLQLFLPSKYLVNIVILRTDVGKFSFVNRTIAD